MSEEINKIKERFKDVCVIPDCTAKTHKDGLCSLHWAGKYSHVPDLAGPDVICKLCGKILRKPEDTVSEPCRVKLGELE